MAVIKSFAAVRPTKELASSVAALPYDVYNRQEAKEEVKGKPYTFLRIDRPETQFPDEQDMYADCVYEKADQMLKDMISEKVLIEEKKKCLYLYELEMDGHIQTGLAALASVDDYLNGVIRKHENTREDKELDRIRHVDTCSMQTGPIFLAYKSNPQIKRLILAAKEEEPVYDFLAEDGIIHRVWVILDEELQDKIQKGFADIERLYIADGHHRTASAVKVGQKRRQQYPDYTGEEEFNYFLSVLFPDDELQILPYNRVVKDLYGLTKEEFLSKIEEYFEIKGPYEEASVPKKKGTMGMYLKDSWYELNLKDTYRIDDEVEGLDVSILQKDILGPVLGILDPRTDDRIRFVGGIRGEKELEIMVQNGYAAAFLMHPTSMDELFAIADAGKLMPPKSTWFEPKLRSGLLLHKIEAV